MTGPVDRRLAPASAPGGLFVAVAGEHDDGHDFAASAVGRRRRRGARRPARRACPPSSSTTSWPRSAGWPRAVRSDRLPGLHVVGVTGSSGQDEHQGPAGPAARAARPDGGAAGLVQQRDRAAADRAGRGPDDPRSSCSRWAPAGLGHIARPVPTSPPPDVGVVLNVGTAHVGEFGSRGGHRAGQGRARRGAARPTAWPCSTPTTRWCAAMAARTDGPGRHVRRVRRGRRPGRRRRARRRGPAALRAGHAPPGGAGRGLRLVGRAPGVATRWPPPRSRCDARRCRSTRSPRRCPRPSRAAAGGWRSSSAPTASPWSTTPTTPTPSRCGPRWRRSWRCAGGPRGPGPCSARCASSGADAHAEHDADRPARGPARRRPARRRRRGRRGRCTWAPGWRAPGTTSRRSSPTSDAAVALLRDAGAPRGRRAGQGVAGGRPRAGGRGAARRPGGRCRMRLDPHRAGGRRCSSACSARRCSSGCLRRHGYAQAIRDSTDGRPTPTHEGKRGTPSMGGLVILVGARARLPGGPPVRAGARRRASGCSCCSSWSGSASVGFADDYIKIFKQRSTGLRARTKLVGQAVVALAFAAARAAVPGRPTGSPRRRRRSRSCATRPSVLPLGAVRALGLRHGRRRRRTG